MDRWRCKLILMEDFDMKKLLLVLILVLAIPFSAQAWTLSWNDVTGEDGYIIRYKDYPSGYSFPEGQACIFEAGLCCWYRSSLE